MARSSNVRKAIADDILIALYDKPEDSLPRTAWEVSRAIKAATGRVWSEAQILATATWLRDPERVKRHGWTIPNFESGSSKSRRWRVIVNGTDLTHNEVNAIEDGYKSSVRHVLTRARGSVAILKLTVSNAPRGRRWMLKSAIEVGSMYITLLERTLALWDDESLDA